MQPSLVRDLRHELAHLRVHPVRRLEEPAEVGGHGRLAAEHVLKRRHLGALGMAALRRLRQLLRIAEQHELRRRAAHREHVGQRLLPRLVDEQHVDRVRHPLARPQPRGAGDHVELLVALPRRPSPSRCTRRCRPSSAGGPSPSAARAPTAPRLATASSRLPITAWLCAVMPTRLPRLHELDDQLRALGRLPRTGRALDGEVRRVERAGVGIAPRAQQQVERGTVRAGRVQAVLDHVLGQALDRRFGHRVVDRRRRDQRVRVRAAERLRAALEVDRAGDVVDRHHLAGSLAGHRIAAACRPP